MPSSTDDRGSGPSTETAIALLTQGQTVIGREVTDMRAENNRQFADLRTELNRTFALKSDVNVIEADTKTLRRDVDKHSEQIGWVVKTVGAAILVALVGLLIAKGGVPHP
ncbi:hypothetical protein ASF28_08835 [Methylobacterium sp. Leaf99]|jgi:hypothetical protein|uniref:hypothetical protein n=1 Tax=Methylobacterium sp. Leaf99 TaxID=1736251 RepID=UPI0007011879|nr:hypothetical protein [Methylobacterium sp. Leaf99]KQP11139.1 hypothetical protein ASF28_08835 [Methylobacterium sp. Leaf99]